MRVEKALVRWVLAIALGLGIWFRFYHLDHKIFWGDEVFTAMRASGYTQSQVVDRTYTGKVLMLAELHQYQHPGDRSTLDTLNALEGSPEHSPLYYLLVRFWLQAWGSNSSAQISRSIATIRSFSAIVSLLVFPAIYWLCLELFNAPLTGWIAVAIVAVSPFHVLYAQEARGYSLWTVTILLSSAALLRAMRKQTIGSWGIYALTVALGLYAFLFSVLVSIAHAVYVCVRSDRWSQIRPYLAASLVGVALFSPWLWVIVSNFGKLRSNVAHLDQNQPALVSLWLLNLSRLFFDFNHGASWFNPLIYVTFALSIGAIGWLYCQTPKATWLFILTLIGVMGMVLILGDLLLGGQRSAIARYPIPCYLGIQISIAACFSHHLRKTAPPLQKRWQLGLVSLLLIGVLSCGISSQAVLWWNKGLFKTRYNSQVAEQINRSSSPLVISDSSIERVLALSYLLQPNTQFQLVKKPHVPQIPNGVEDVFLYQPSIALKNKLERRQNYQFVSSDEGWLWRGSPATKGDPNRN